MGGAVGWIARPVSGAFWADRLDIAAGACIEIARCWAWLPELARAAAIEACRGRWGPAVAAAAADPAPEVRAGAADLAREAGDPRLLEGIFGLLGDTDRRVSDAAERAYLAAAQRGGREGRDETERRVAMALAAFDRHRRRGVLEAAVRLADTGFLARMRAGAGGLLGEVLGDEGQPFQMPLRSFIRKSAEPWVRGRAWEWLGEGLATGAVAERLGRAATAAEHGAVLDRAHLLANPRRAARAGAIRGRDGGSGAAVPEEGVLGHLSAGAKAGLPRWLEALGAPVAARQGAAELLLRDPSPRVRFAGLRSASAGSVARACVDVDGRVAGSALRRASDAGLERRRARGRSMPGLAELEALGGHESPAVRALVAQERARLDPWDAGSAAGRLAARARLAAGPEDFCGEVRERLSSGVIAIGALLLIRALGLHARFEGTLLAMLGAAPDRSGQSLDRRSGLAPGVLGHDGQSTAFPLAHDTSRKGGSTVAVIALPDRSSVAESEGEDRLTPMVLGVLGESASEAARRAVDEHLRDGRPRMRANAVEALARQARAAPRGDRRADVLIELKNDPHHRVRANAIRGLFHRGRLFGEPGPYGAEPVALDALGLMLSDVRVGHRIAAIWLAGRVAPAEGAGMRRWSDLTGRIADLARHDPDPAARARAAGAASRMVVGMRERWRSAAAEVEASVAAAGGGA